MVVVDTWSGRALLFVFDEVLFLLHAGCMAAAWGRRPLARPQADYLPLDVSNDRQPPWRRGSSDSEDESDMNNLHFVPKMRTLRQRMAEHMGEFVPFLPEAVSFFY